MKKYKNTKRITITSPLFYFGLGMFILTIFNSIVILTGVYVPPDIPLGLVSYVNFLGPFVFGSMIRNSTKIKTVTTELSEAEKLLGD